MPHVPIFCSPEFEGKSGVGLYGDGKWKLGKIELSLFDMENDPFETTNVISENPEVAKKLMGYAELHKEKFFSN